MSAKFSVRLANAGLSVRIFGWSSKQVSTIDGMRRWDRILLNILCGLSLVCCLASGFFWIAVPSTEFNARLGADDHIYFAGVTERRLGIVVLDLRAVPAKERAEVVSEFTQFGGAVSQWYAWEESNQRFDWGGEPDRISIHNSSPVVPYRWRLFPLWLVPLVFALMPLRWVQRQFVPMRATTALSAISMVLVASLGVAWYLTHGSPRMLAYHNEGSTRSFSSERGVLQYDTFKEWADFGPFDGWRWETYWTPIGDTWMGFAAERYHDVNGFGGASGYRVAAPYWFLMMIAGIAPTVWAWGRLRQRRRRRMNLCLTCGYDLRGSSSGCPECGEGRTKEPHDAARAVPSR